MANVKIAGNVFVVESAFTMSELLMVKKFRPAALTLTDDKGDTSFIVGVTGKGGISEYGVTFNSTAPDGSDKAILTILIPEGVDDTKAFVADYVGVSILNLLKIEETLPAVLEEIKNEKSAVEAQITFA